MSEGDAPATPLVARLDEVLTGDRPAASTGWRRHLHLLWLVLVVVLFCLPLFVGLGQFDLKNDEAIYSYAVDSILETGDWLNPRSSPIPNAVFLEKPPLKFWIVALPIRLGLLPDDEFGLRFWDAVFGSLAFLYVFAMGRRMGGPLGGLVALVVLFSYEPLIFEHGLRGNNMEAPLLLAYCGGVFHFLRWSDSEAPRRRRWHAFAVGLYFLLGFMTKFVAALFLPMIFATVGFLLPQMRARVRSERRLWAGVAAGVTALVVPWFVYQTVRAGSGVWDMMFGWQVIVRFTSSLDPSHLHPWSYYLVEMWTQLNHAGGAWLVAAGCVLVLARALRERWPDGLMVVTWFALPIALMSLGTSKLGHYAFPYLPPLALAAGYAPTWAIRVTRAPLERAMTMVDRWASKLRVPSVLRTVFAVLAVGLALVATITLLYGGFRLRVGGVRLFSNRYVLRPALAALLLEAFGARGVLVSRLMIGVLVLSLAPIPAYRDVLPRLAVEAHPLRSVKTCVQEVREQMRQAGHPAPGFLAWLPEGFQHQYFFYLRNAGWELKDEVSERDLRRALEVPNFLRPVLLPGPRYAEFLARRHPSPKEHLLTPLSDLVGTRPALEEWAGRRTRGIELGEGVVLVLPGPYGVCGPVTSLTFAPSHFVPAEGQPDPHRKGP